MYLFFGTLGLMLASRGLIEASPSNSHVLHNSLDVSNQSRSVVSTPNGIYSGERHENFSERVLTRRDSTDIEIPDYPTNYAAFGSVEDVIKELVTIKRELDYATKQIARYGLNIEGNKYVTHHIRDIILEQIRRSLFKIRSGRQKRGEDVKYVFSYFKHLSNSVKRFREEALTKKRILVETRSLNDLTRYLRDGIRLAVGFVQVLVTLMPPEFEQQMREYGKHIEISLAKELEIIGGKANYVP